MKLSIREAKSRLSEVAAAAARGERVIITKHGQPFVELILAQKASGMDESQAEQVRRDLGLNGLTVRLGPEFDDSAFGRAVLGLTE